jgi:glycosyltransferase involved in cell wall biosynthesis
MDFKKGRTTSVQSAGKNPTPASERAKRVSIKIIIVILSSVGDSLQKSQLNSLKAAVYAPYIYRWMLDFVRELSNLLGEVRFYAQGIYGNYPWKQYERYVRLINKRTLFRVIADYLRYRPDVVIILGSETGISLAMTALSSIIGTSKVLIVEENRERTFASLFLRCLSRVKRQCVVATHKGADVLVAESQPAKDYLVRMGCRQKRIHIIPHGTNISEFKPHIKSQLLATRLGLSENDTRRCTVLFVGEFNEYKGAEFMARAILDFPRLDGIIFLIPRNGAVFSKYEQQFEAMENVYTYASLEDPCMPYLYGLADIVVVPSKLCEAGSSDRSPNSLIEAMACGKAVIGTTVGGIPAIMNDAGILIRPNDPAAIIDAILALTADLPRRELLGTRARERAVAALNNHYYALHIVQLWERAYG